METSREASPTTAPRSNILSFIYTSEPRSKIEVTCRERCPTVWSSARPGLTSSSSVTGKAVLGNGRLACECSSEKQFIQNIPWHRLLFPALLLLPWKTLRRRHRPYERNTQRYHLTARSHSQWMDHYLCTSSKILGNSQHTLLRHFWAFGRWTSTYKS